MKSNMLPRIALLLFALLPCTLQAQRLPLWEFGVGAGALHLPDYRGSDQYAAYLIPFPYLIYRGDRLKVDEGGVHGHLLQTRRARLDISLAGGVPVAEDGDSLRSGMPGLDPTVEFGPSLELVIWRNRDRRRTWWLRLPGRAVFSASLNNGIAAQGWAFAPHLEYIVESAHRGDWKAGIAYGPLYGDESYHRYFYAVADQYQTAQRPAYQPSGGYGGSRITLTLQKNIEDLWLGAMLRYDDLEGAVFTGSPLVASHEYLAAGIAFTWVFAKSTTLVSREP